MPDSGVLPGDDRLLVLAPTGRDGALTCALLRSAGLVGDQCRTIEELCHRFESEGAACLLVAEEVLVPAAFARLAGCLADQPPWSDVPVILFTGQGAMVQARMPTSRLIAPLGNVTLLDRPLRPITMLSAVGAAVRARRRQYATRRELWLQQQAVEARDQFLAMLGHELRNPLTAIRMAVELMERGAENPRHRAVIRHQTDHLARLVDDLLDVARVTSGKIKLERRTTDLAHVVEHALDALQAELRTDRHQVTCDAGRPVPVDGDPARLEQIAVNLLTNALKYTPAGGRIDVAVRAEGGEAVLVVRDTGVGIARDRLEAVFELFTQVDTTLDRSQGGIGVGLTLVRRLVEMHGGRIDASSPGPGGGSTFTVRLPLAASASSDARRLPSPRATGRRVLLIEDNADSRELMAEFLALSGHRVETAADGRSALDLARSWRPEVMLVDVGLPGLDGYGVARAIRAEHGGGMLLVAITGYGQAEDRRRALSAGFDAHFTKPIDLDALTALLAAEAVGAT